jgi:hypothetical protein
VKRLINSHTNYMDEIKKDAPSTTDKPAVPEVPVKAPEGGPKIEGVHNK